jgi:hypothetical protein
MPWFLIPKPRPRASALTRGITACALRQSTSCTEFPYIPGNSVAGLSEKNGPAAQCITQHYSSLFKKVCDEATPLGRFQGAVFSQLTKGFLGFNLENLTDIAELRSLYGLIGGYGMALIESDLVRVIVGRAERIRAFIASNSSALHSFKQKHADAEGWEGVLGAAARDLKGLDDFLADLMVIGNAVAMRRGIAEAVRQSQAETVPFAGSAVAMARVAIKREAYEDTTQVTRPGLDLLEYAVLGSCVATAGALVPGAGVVRPYGLARRPRRRPLGQSCRPLARR